MVPDILLNKNQIAMDYTDAENYADRYTLLQGVKAKLAESGEPSFKFKKRVKMGPGTGGGAYYNQKKS